MNDRLGTPQKLINNSGATVWSAEYSAFDEADVASASSVSNPLRFPGQYFDKETGTDYNYFRTYDPSLGRYLQSDPIGLGSGINTYAYVNSNPMIYIDPTVKILVNLGAVLVTGLVTGVVDEVVNTLLNSRNECVSLGDHFFAGFIGGATLNPVLAGGLAWTNGLNSRNSGGSQGGILQSAIVGGGIGLVSGLVGGAVGGYSDPFTVGASSVAAEAFGSVVSSDLGVGCQCK